MQGIQLLEVVVELVGLEPHTARQISLHYDFKQIQHLVLIRLLRVCVRHLRLVSRGLRFAAKLLVEKPFYSTRNNSFNQLPVLLDAAVGLESP